MAESAMQACSREQSAVGDGVHANVPGVRLDAIAWYVNWPSAARFVALAAEEHARAFRQWDEAFRDSIIFTYYSDSP